MRILTEKKAKGLCCPIRNLERNEESLGCDASRCMAWVKFEGLPQTEEKGYCNIIYKKNSRPEVIINHITTREGCSIEEPDTKEPTDG